MAFAPQFLDELKSRVGLADIIGKRVRLQKKGREHSGLCPFHSEKTPSFTVNEEKGFYHCFGCGEHGSVFDFVMKSDNLSFPEAVERLALDAGMEVPRATPEEQERAKRAATHYEVLEAAAGFYEKQLRMPVGKAALDYLTGRGISEQSISRYRLGFAPDNRGALKSALAADGVASDLMVDAGLLIQPDDGARDPYDRFRGRVMFPITDRRGRVIAFGGRILGDGEPKYLNSPETPLFHKGFNLYGLAQALDGARKRDTFIVTEGYTDVIALDQAGFNTAVAPLGTALTEDQIQLLWRTAPEPYLCFDGDKAGQRAAFRAAERALAILKPGYGLKFVVLPEGEDPDSLVKSRGIDAVSKLMASAVHLSEIIWRMEIAGYKIVTPEDRAALEKRLKDQTSRINDETVRRIYFNIFKNKLWEKFKKSQPAPGSKKYKNVEKSFQMDEKSGSATQVRTRQVQEEILLTTVITHPELFDPVGEQLGTLSFEAQDLDNLRQEALKVLSGSPALDFEALADHLCKTGFSDLMGGLLSRRVYDHAYFARPSEPLEIAKDAWEQTLRLYKRNQLLDEIVAAKTRLAEDFTAEAFELLKALKESAMVVEDAEPVSVKFMSQSDDAA